MTTGELLTVVVSIVSTLVAVGLPAITKFSSLSERIKALEVHQQNDQAKTAGVQSAVEDLVEILKERV